MSTRHSALLGLELAENAVTSVVTDLAGGILAAASAPVAGSRARSGRVEANPHDWLAAAILTIRRTVHEAGVQPQAIGVTGHSRGLVLWLRAQLTGDVRSERSDAGLLTPPAADMIGLPAGTPVTAGRPAAGLPAVPHHPVEPKGSHPMTASPPMRRVVADRDQVVVTHVERPEPGPQDALVRMSVTGVCGSDTHAVHGRHPFIPLPYHPGHEVVGVVESVGADVTAVAPGQRVTVEPTLPCGRCKTCTTGRANLCEELRFFGCGWDQGGMADFFTIPAGRLHAVPDDLDDLTAALIEPLSTPVHAVRLAGDVAGRTVAVLGAGPIGLLVLAVVRAHGARRVVVTDMLPAKRERALALGADATVDAAAADVAKQVRGALGESADVVFDCVAVQSTVGQAVALASKGGTVVIVGVPAREVSVPLPVIQDHQIRIQGSATYLAEDYRESMRLLQTAAVRRADIVTAVHGLDEAASAFADAASGEHIKVLITAGA